MTQDNNHVADRVKEVAAFDPEMGAYNFGNLGDAVKFADLMCAAGPLLPKFMQGNAPLCLGVTMRATHWGFDPFALAMEAYQAKDGGPVGYQSKVFAAALQQCTGIELRYRYEGTTEYTGKPAKSAKGNQVAPNEATGDRVCIAYATIDGETVEMRSPPLNAIHPKNSALWHTKPDQQLAYYTGRDWVRLYRPAVMLGAYSNDEVEEMTPLRDITPSKPEGSSFASRAIAARNQARAEQAPAEEAVNSNETTIDGKASDVSDLPTESHPTQGGNDDEGAARGDVAPSPDDHDDEGPTEAFKAGALACLDGAADTDCPPDLSKDDKAEWLAGFASAPGPIEKTTEEENDQ